jgi:hypothetical protein
MEPILLAVGAIVGYVFGRRQNGSRPSPGHDIDSPGVAKRKAEYSLNKNLSELTGYTSAVLKHFGSDLLRCAPIMYPAPTDDDRTVYAKDAVRLAARRYGVEIRNLHIRFAPKPVGKEAGSLRQKGDQFYLDVLERYRDNDVALYAIIAHEMAHYAMAQKGLVDPDEQKNERLTDCLTVLGGFGPVVLEAYHTEFNLENERFSGYASYGLGYLHPSALAYLTFIQSEVAGVRSRLLDVLKSPWMREPAQIWKELVTQRSMNDAAVPSCLICGELLPLPDPGTNRNTTCKLCRYTQPFPSSGETTNSSFAQ